MSQAEVAVFAIFQRFGVTPYQMLFLNSNTDDQIQPAITGLVKKGWVVREKHRHAYHLTVAGHKAMQSVGRERRGAARS